MTPGEAIAWARGVLNRPDQIPTVDMEALRVLTAMASVYLPQLGEWAGLTPVEVDA